MAVEWRECPLHSLHNFMDLGREGGREGGSEWLVFVHIYCATAVMVTGWARAWPPLERPEWAWALLSSPLLSSPADFIPISFLGDALRCYVRRFACCNNPSFVV